MPFGVNSDPSFRAQKQRIRVRVSSFGIAGTVCLARAWDIPQTMQRKFEKRSISMIFLKEEHNPHTYIYNTPKQLSKKMLQANTTTLPRKFHK